MRPVIIVPGLHDSPPGHWQSRWSESLPDVRRVHQDEWESPRRVPWVQRLSEVILSTNEPVVIAAHSLGCMATVHLPPVVAQRVAGALLVAPADPLRRAILADFAPVPYQRLPYASIVVASTNDPYCPHRVAAAYAKSWGSDLVTLRDAGHINVASGHGDWPVGLSLLQGMLERRLEGPVKASEPAYPIFA